MRESLDIARADGRREMARATVALAVSVIDERTRERDDAREKLRALVEATDALDRAAAAWNDDIPSDEALDARVGDRVAIRGNRCGDDVVTKVGRLLVHCGRDAYEIESGRQGSGTRYGFGRTAWEPDAFEASLRIDTKADRVAKAFRGYAPTALTESQLDRILAILEEVQT